jgi:aspartyl-tRNA(Asn)/glutamyl-tRNA(Gln) amidotransferase subunit C/ribosomal-protein-alanine N-acetyltransferase
VVSARAIETPRLRLRPPVAADAQNIFVRYASNPRVTRYLGWPTHRTPADTEVFLAFCADQWERWPAGPYLIESRADGTLVGSTGLLFETPQQAATGYVLAEDAWGLGYATEALGAMRDRAGQLGVERVYALCHPEHRASARVLEKCGFLCEGTLRGFAEFPNLAPGLQADVLCYAMRYPRV